MEYLKQCTYFVRVSLTLCIVFPLQHILLCYDLPNVHHNNKRSLNRPSKKNTLIDVDAMTRGNLFLKRRDFNVGAVSRTVIENTSSDASNLLSILGQAQPKQTASDMRKNVLQGLLLSPQTNEMPQEVTISNSDTMKNLTQRLSDSEQKNAYSKATAELPLTNMTSIPNIIKSLGMYSNHEQINTPRKKACGGTSQAFTAQRRNLKLRSKRNFSFRERRSVGDTVVWSGADIISPTDNMAGIISTGLDDFETHDIDVYEVCKRYPRSVLPHPRNCALSINCTAPPDAVMKTYYRSYVFECPYPQLFSEVTMQCEDFGDVECRGKFEPKSPCEYHSNQCHQSSHCIPCWARYVSCKGLAEGLNPWRGKEWQPLFVECHRERTVFQGVCAPNAVFSPVTRACETPLTVPSKHGGWKPVCAGRMDGSYPDELGRCKLFFVCKSQLFRGFHRCGTETKFNPWTSRCERPETVPFPCGNRNTMPGLCRRRADGNYLDVFGRCSHYFTCRNRVLKGFHVCPTGSFNVESRQCKGSDNVARRLQFQPCGDRKNKCLHRKDGVYALGCHRQIVCSRGLVIAVLQRNPHSCLQGKSRRTKG